MISLKFLDLFQQLELLVSKIENVSESLFHNKYRFDVKSVIKEVIIMH